MTFHWKVKVNVTPPLIVFFLATWGQCNELYTHVYILSHYKVVVENVSTQQTGRNIHLDHQAT